MRRFLTLLLTVALLTMGAAGAWAATTVRVTGNTVDTSLGENGSAGWWFNRDPNVNAPFEFNFDEASTGFGSLYVLPINAGPGQKFVAEHFLFAPITADTAISFDYLRGPGSNANHFYLNVYANTEADSKFYDCRFDYVASGSSSEWSTVSSTSTPPTVTRSGSARIAACPANLAGMPPGSTIRSFSINVGQSNDSDVGVSGYLDNVTVTGSGATTVYDFEVPVLVKEACKDGGFVRYGFANQGQCVSSLQANTNGGR